MTDKQHPITTPKELVQQWLDEWMTNVLPGTAPQYIATKAANWGANQELEACCEHISEWYEAPEFRVTQLRAARRPKPKSLAEEATLELDEAAMRGDCVTTTEAMPVLRRALKRLQELEGRGDG